MPDIADWESVALQNFVASAQVAVGQALDFSHADLPHVFGDLIQGLPTGLGTLADRIGRLILIEIVCRIETTVTRPEHSVCFSRRILSLTSAPTAQMRREFQ